jgi:glycosyltransferase involved in cell wall biosynthesis
MRAAQLRWTVRRTIGTAARVLTVSEFSREAILRAYPELDAGRVLVVPNAAAQVFRPVPRETAAGRVLRRFGMAAPFVLTVGDLQPRKNHLGLMAAFEELVRRHPGLPHNLVVAGKSTWSSGRIYQAARQSGIADRIRFTGFVSDAELVDLYNASELVVFPSLYEGFGLPIVEAMACARAVACSNNSAVAEVADGAAILFDPRSPSEMARAMSDVLLDPGLRARLERLGAKRAAQFSWNHAARLTRDVYRDVAPPARRPVRELAR